MLINSINLEIVGAHVEAGNMGTRRYFRRQAKQSICTELLVFKQGFLEPPQHCTFSFVWDSFQVLELLPMSWWAEPGVIDKGNM